LVRTQGSGKERKTGRCISDLFPLTRALRERLTWKYGGMKKLDAGVGF